jgi:hypothetical protein
MVNLITKAFILFFFQHPKKRLPKVLASIKQKGRDEEEDVLSLQDLEALWVNHDDLEQDIAPADASADDEACDDVDEAKAMHNKEVVSNLQDQAIKDCRELHGIVFPVHSKQEALELIMKVCRISFIMLILTTDWL